MFQAQAAEYERQLSEHVAELKASLLKTQAASREKELLDARHKERFQVCAGTRMNFRVSEKRRQIAS